MTEGEQLLTPVQVAAWLGVSKKTLYKWRHAGDGPPGFRVHGLLRYRHGDVARWIDQARQLERDDEHDAVDRAREEADHDRRYDQ